MSRVLYFQLKRYLLTPQAWAGVAEQVDIELDHTLFMQALIITKN